MEICISLTQQKYINDLLSRFNMCDSKVVSTPMDLSLKINKQSCANIKDNSTKSKDVPYQQLIGSLLYLSTNTRPDISFSVSYLSQYNNNYGQMHWNAAKRVLRYLKGTKDVGLTFRKSNEDLKGYADADWGSNEDDRRSFTGYAFLLNNAALSWESRKQRTVALSTCEAEYMALTEAAKEAKYLKNFLIEIGYRKDDPVRLLNDNKSAQQIASNPVHNSRTKHIDIKHHFIRDALLHKDVILEYIGTEDMAAAILTKKLSSPKHQRCMSLLGLRKCN